MKKYDENWVARDVGDTYGIGHPPSGGTPHE